MQEYSAIPSEPGTYVLILLLDQTETIQIGKHGVWEFPTGTYAYVGSARGPGGLSGRLRRHLRVSHKKRLHWHIDYLASVADIVQIWWSEDSINCECIWAKKLALIGTRLVPGFGSSDCRCPGHLLWFPNHQAVNASNIHQVIGPNLNSLPIHTPNGVRSTFIITAP
jgi:Uri superfamily endonuclease